MTSLRRFQLRDRTPCCSVSRAGRGTSRPGCRNACAARKRGTPHERRQSHLRSLFAELGVSHVFGLPGTQNVLLYEALRTRGMRSIVASDEGAAAFMTAGYARASGRVGVLTTIPGPGFVYALAGIVEALHDSVPLLWVTLRQADNGRAFQLQQIDQAAMAKPVVKRCMLVERTENWPVRCRGTCGSRSRRAWAGIA